MNRLLRPWRRLALAYHVRCAREDARARNLVTPLGVWVCEHCPHVSLSQLSFVEHLAFGHV